MQNLLREFGYYCAVALYNLAKKKGENPFIVLALNVGALFVVASL